MIFEKWNVKFDITKLQQHLAEHVLPLQAIYQSPSFGGWSVLSSDGSYRDGWHLGHLGMKSSMTLEEIKSLDVSNKGKPSRAYHVPTEICTGYLNEVIETIKSAQLEPCRARIIQLPPGHACVWHRDAPDNTYAVRLHIPIHTNDGCFFEVEDERAHLAADGSAYFIYVNRVHRVVNTGTTPRYHLVMNITDSAGVSLHHRYNAENELN